VKFGPVPVQEAVGAILAHSVALGGARLRKGVVLTAEHVGALVAAGVNDVVVARLDAGDLHEDEAARRLADALVPDPEAAHVRLTRPFTGRVNLIAETPGVAVLDEAAIARVNAVDPMITVATVPAYQQLATGGMIATIKIISYGVAEAHLAQAEEVGRDAIRMAPPRRASAGLIVTDIPGAADADKGIDAIAARLAALGMQLAETRIVPHDTPSIAGAIGAVAGEIVLILTASATSDPADVAPEAVRRAGGRVDRFGMPVDPGNLLFLGQLGARPVIGLPGCARSPALNGADWVLSRIACGIEVTGADIAAMGVGGLLKEIPTRPQPRAGRKGP
jgi:molybdenum cofactor cytidylyltransferase